MTDNDPFAGWSEEYKESQARYTARLLKHFGQCEHQAARNLKEAQTYYSSEQWMADGVEIEALDRLINELQERTDTTGALRHQTETRLDDILRSQRSHASTRPLAERRQDIIRAATPFQNAEATIEPTPLEGFLQSARKTETTPALKPKKRKKALTL